MLQRNLEHKITAKVRVFVGQRLKAISGNYFSQVYFLCILGKLRRGQRKRDRRTGQTDRQADRQTGGLADFAALKTVKRGKNQVPLDA